jgi:hypothetical protein
MLLRPTFILLLISALSVAQPRQVNDRLLPEELTEAETQTILKEQKPKPHIEATLKVSDMRLSHAYDIVQEGKHKAAVQDVDVYASLIRYADSYTRKLPNSQIKDRNHCLKRIEQAIFKQTRTLDAVVRELPFDHREPTERLVNEVKKIRLRAINDLIGGGTIINSSNEQ